MARERIVLIAEEPRYELGEQKYYVGIWKKSIWFGRQLVSRYDLTDEGWRAVREEFDRLEPTARWYEDDEGPAASASRPAPYVTDTGQDWTARAIGITLGAVGLVATGWFWTNPVGTSNTSAGNCGAPVVATFGHGDPTNIRYCEDLSREQVVTGGVVGAILVVGGYLAGPVSRRRSL